MLTPAYLTPANQNHYCKTPYYPLQVGTHNFEGISALWPLLPGKAIKLFCSTSPKTLSPSFNLVLGYRGQIQLNTLFHLASRMSQSLHLPPNLSALPSQLPLFVSPHIPRHCVCRIPGLILHLLFSICTDSLDDLSQSTGYKYHRNADRSQFLFLLRFAIEFKPHTSNDL